ncbi:hypothetical protein [Psychroflexus tropicus]|uniref:hypothetical protein n=1 Tax=Psychroflexus tropicus TaxID=197345 RepID=UPI00037F567B|nr:hypothetical protein [Psychroflexus tropicus]
MKKITFIILFVFFSCIEEKKDETKVTMVFRSEYDETIQLFFTDDEHPKFNNNNLLKKKVLGSRQYQRIVFEIPKKIKPRRFRIDLGEEKYTTSLYIKTITIDFGSKQITIDDDTFDRYFSTNIYLKKEGRNRFERKLINRSYDPFIKSTPLLEKKMFIEFR